MKRLFVIVLLILSILCFAACNSKPQGEDSTLLNNVSLRHEYYFSGATEDYAVTIEIGKREKVLVADGKVGDICTYTEISVRNLSGDLEGAYSFEISAGDSKLNGTLSKNVFGSCLTSTLNLFEHAENITGFYLICGDSRVEIPVVNLLSEGKSWQEALTIAETEFSDRISENSVDGVLPREIYVKYVSDGFTVEAPHFWYVAFIGENNGFWAVLIDPATGNVVSKK